MTDHKRLSNHYLQDNDKNQSLSDLIIEIKISVNSEKNTSYLDIRSFFTPNRFLYDVKILQKIILTKKKHKNIYIRNLVLYVTNSVNYPDFFSIEIIGVPKVFHYRDHYKKKTIIIYKIS